jgi:hypothetical protein
VTGVNTYIMLRAEPGAGSIHIVTGQFAAQWLRMHHCWSACKKLSPA